jgi:transcriptional regulator with XRE-family HTH domain
MASDEEIDERERIPNDGIGTRVMQVRNRRRLKQTQLAHAVGVDQATIHRLENGDTQQVSVVLLNNIAMYLKVSLDFLRA